MGAILCINMVYMVNLSYNNPDFASNDLLGYAAMLVVMSLIFFGIRNYRNKDLGGFISLGKAFKVGLLIALLASVMYVVVWVFYYYLFVPDYLDFYIDHVLKQTPESEVAARAKEMEEFKTLYDNPVFVVLITFSEVLPLGIVVALISALILKKKPKQVQAA